MALAAGTVAIAWLVAAAADASGATPPPSLAMIPWAGVGVEPSGIAAVEGGYLIAEDELVGSVLFVPGEPAEGAAARIVKLERPRGDVSADAPRLIPVEDFEGLASDGRRIVYLLGSHASRRDGEDWKRRPEREFIIRAEWRARRGDLRVSRIEVEDARGARKKLHRRVYRDLREHLRAGGAGDLAGLEAEGIALAEGRLFVGLRAPLDEAGRAQLLVADEAELFGPDFDGRWTRQAIDLGGGGVRGLYWERRRRRLLILAGPDGGEPPVASLWSYDPGTKETERLLSLPADKGVPEGICRGAEGLLMVVDPADGGQPPLLHLPDPGTGPAR